MIDWAHVIEMKTELGADFDLVVSLFLDEVGEVVARLEGPSPPPHLAADLHFLKGAALNLGFSELARCCASVEHQVRAGTAAADLAAVLACYRASCAAFRDGPA